MAAIRTSAALVLLLTRAANDSPDVLQEVQIAHAERRLIVPVVIDGVMPSDDLARPRAALAS
jgi:hypothetical protein